jgi:hypothetical protein
MKIISKFHDYYDTVAAHGVSDGYYFRTPSIHPISGAKYEPFLGNGMRLGSEFDYSVILFCGQVFPCIQVKTLQERYTVTRGEFSIFNMETYDKYQKLVREDLGFKGSPRWPAFRSKADWFDQVKTDRDSMEKYFEGLNSLDSGFIHRELNAPIIHVRHEPSRNSYGRRVFEANPQLKGLGFQSVKDPFTAYQELDSYLSGVMGVETRPPVEISDVHRLEGHGFDKKTSFRKGKS